MPELPEVESFRQTLLTLVGGVSETVTFECPPPLPTKRFPTQDVFDTINQGNYVIKDVLRKGKLMCIILHKKKSKKKPRSTKSKEKSDVNNTNQTISGDESILYLSLHMGMTGRISSPGNVPGLESLSKDDAYPPPHTHLILKSNGDEAAFSDPRRFGSVSIEIGEDKDGDDICEDSLPGFSELAVDALVTSEDYCTTKKKKNKSTSSDTMQQQTIVEKIANRKKGIKGLLLDQKTVVSGVGNWVADEILYRSSIHPDQSYLTTEETEILVKEMYYVLSTAVEYPDNYPLEWLFHRRWRNSAGGAHAKDVHGKSIKFIQSGGRSTAIVPSLQKIVGRKSSAGKAKKKEYKDVKKDRSTAKPKAQPKKRKASGDDSDEKASAKKKKVSSTSKSSAAESRATRKSNRLSR